VDILLPDARNATAWRVNVLSGEPQLIGDVQLANPQIRRMISVAGSRDGRFLVVQPERGNMLAVVDMSCLVRP
jgi:hypothetical protein